MPRSGDTKKRVEQILAIRRRALEVIQSLPEDYAAAMAVLEFARELVEGNLNPDKIAEEMKLGQLTLVELPERGEHAHAPPEARPAPCA